MRYHPTQDGEWVKPRMKGYRMKCCDCGLIHELDFKVVWSNSGRGPAVMFRARRNQRATAAVRRVR